MPKALNYDNYAKKTHHSQKNVRSRSTYRFIIPGVRFFTAMPPESKARANPRSVKSADLREARIRGCDSSSPASGISAEILAANCEEKERQGSGRAPPGFAYPGKG